MAKRLILIWVLFLLPSTGHRVFVWGNNLTLWADAAQVSPVKPRSLINYAEMLDRKGDADQALIYFRRAFAATTWRTDQRSNISKLYAATDLVHVLAARREYAEMWKILQESGCTETRKGNRIDWVCKTTQWW